MSFLEIPRPSQLPISPSRHGVKNIRKSIGSSPISAYMTDRHKSLVNEFEEIDKNHDRELNYEEIVEFLSKKQGTGFDQKLCLDLFQRMDKDKDGVITIDEFIWSYVEQEESIQNRIKDVKKGIFENTKKMDEFKRKLIQARTSQSFNSYGIMHGSKVKVEVFDAKELIPMDRNGLSDPYAILEIGSHKEQTKYIRETLNPSWMEEFAFPIETGREVLKVTVMDKDVLPPDDFEGQIEINISNYKDQMKHEQYFHLLGQNNEEGNFGKIKLSIHWVWSQTKYIEDVLHQWEEVLDADKKELVSLEDDLNKLKKPFGYLDRQSDWIIREDRSMSTRMTGDMGIVQSFGRTEKRFSLFVESNLLGAPAILLYVVVSVLVMFSRPDFFNVLGI
jgi:Ca2+-binding EF-hand superfamily protein